jgi:hypothetical protein
MVNPGTGDEKNCYYVRRILKVIQSLPAAGDSLENDNQDNCLIYIPKQQQLIKRHVLFLRV